ncbi:ADP-ribosylglycohydrolase family protein [Photobacterium leiognathi]|uniref:ADP-ribosylglycohydrolase family protein n=1 Tax=Photobacterium leiognathi TaxID=553611 RepID=UPI0029810101|nr:ADP-ribosylglycohydrolase family protein [Photobacterium leiognathi]
MTDIRHQATIRSALWAAYGDALGFITELSKDKSTIKHRSGLERIESLVPWRRVLGGMYGTSVNLVSGCYSDDTQLRLSTSRAINGQGFFDVEAFAKFELTVWQTYALGAGRGTKAATQSLTQKSKNWFNNFFTAKDIIYTNVGGNGAAMRIQPHVWAAQELSNSKSFQTDVVKNSITTHGHPRGIAGAFFHAASLATLLKGSQLTMDKLVSIAESCADIPQIIYADEYLSNIWLPEWEDLSETNIEQAFKKVSNEILNDLTIAKDWLNSPQEDYDKLINDLNLNLPTERGSGTKTALVASLLVLNLNKSSIKQIMNDVVNQLDSDTDTIATMFGALAGVVVDERPNETVQDENYIINEASRLYNLSQEKDVSCFTYPDLLNWVPQRSIVSNVTLKNNKLVLNGFGTIKPISKPFNGRQKGHYYQWFEVSQGFTALIKVKSDFEAYTEQETVSNVVNMSNNLSHTNQPIDTNQQHNLPFSLKEETIVDNNIDYSIDSLTKKAIDSQFDPKIIGEHILFLTTQQDMPIEKIISYSSIVAKAKISRDKRKTNI